MFIEIEDGLRARLCHQTGLTQVSDLPYTGSVISKSYLKSPSLSFLFVKGTNNDFWNLELFCGLNKFMHIKHLLV